MTLETAKVILAKHAEIRRLICAQVGELGAVHEHLGTAEETFRLPYTGDADTRARADSYEDLRVAAAQVGVLAHEATLLAELLLELNGGAS